MSEDRDGTEDRTFGIGPGDDTLDTAFDEAEIGAAYGVRRISERNPEAVLQEPSQTTNTFERIGRSELREHYGIVRTFFKRRARSYQTFQRQLTQAWLAETYDRYLTRTIRRMVAVFVAVAVLCVCLTVGLVGGARAGYIPALRAWATVPLGSVATATALTSVSAGVVSAGLYWAWYRVYRLRTRVTQRRREIDYNLPFAVTFMYALSRAGVSFEQILTRLADSQSTYGAISQEYDRVVRDMEMFGNNLYIGMDNLRAVTPSEELKRLTDDLMTVLETGGDLSEFLRDEVDMQLQAATEKQETFIEQLELLSEVFIVGFVAAPLFVLVVLIVISFLGGNTVPVISLLVYVAIPLALAGFVVLVDALSQPFRATPVKFTGGNSFPTTTGPDAPEWGEQYEQDKRLTGIRKRLAARLRQAQRRPGQAFVFSVPIALTVPITGLWLGEFPGTLSALLASPVSGTIALAVIPLAIATTPVILVYEYRARQEATFKRRFPVLLELLAASNRRGLSLTKGLDIVTDSAEGRVATELRRLRNDIRWNADTASAFEAFGERIRIPELGRTMKLIAEGSRATSDLHPVLAVAALDTTERIRLQQQRKQTLQTYLAIVIIGFLVYLLVVLMLAANFLEPIEVLRAAETSETAGPISLASIPVERLRLVLFHSALIQGFASGVLAGKLAEDSLYSGLKYGLGLVLIAAAAFTVV